MANWSLPTLSDTWANLIAFFKNRDEDLVRQLDPATTGGGPTNTPTNAIRWSSAGNKWEKFNGTSWADLTGTYAIAISGVAGSVAFANITGKPTTLSGYGITDGQPLDADLTALAALASTAGMLARTGAGAFAVRTLTAPAAGMTISNNTGAAGNPTWALANDLAALEALGSTGFAARTAADAWAQRTIVGTTNRIGVTNGNGVSGNPTLDIGSDVVTLTGSQTLTNKVHTNPDNTVQTLTDGATINWNMASGGIATVTLAGNRTFAAPTNLKRGTYILHVIQDATGSRTLTWNSVFKWSFAVAPVLSTGAGKRDVITFICDGTNLYGAALLDVR